MAQTQYSLSWEDHPKNICSGLSYLQQNGEFVDMTLAADGHFVKVHQVIIALSSPFLKDLIASAQCAHPVIVLNKVSHSTLSAILEYIYRGEVLVAIEDIKDLIEAAKELHIKGLQEIDLSVTKPVKNAKDNDVAVSVDTNCDNVDDENNISYFEISRQTDPIIKQIVIDDVSMNETANSSSSLHHMIDCDNLHVLPNDTNILSQQFPVVLKATDLRDNVIEKTSTLQYTISTHGSLQLILNRFLYFLKNTRVDRRRQWRCVDYLRSSKCPAVVITKDNVVLQRIKAHKHPFHDQKIWKKVRSNNVFSEISEIVDSEQPGAGRPDAYSE